MGEEREGKVIRAVGNLLPSGKAGFEVDGMGRNGPQ